jgi:uncharacterized membrane protein
MPVAEVVAVFGAAIVEIWGAVPIGLALGLPAPVIWTAAVAGSFVSVTVVALAGDALRAWIVRRRGQRTLAGQGRLYRIWVRWGVVGWGLVSPLVFAPPMGTAIAIALGAPRRRLLTSMAAGVLLWVTILVAAGEGGIAILHGIR